VIDGAVGEHLKILRLVGRGRILVLLVEGVHHADTLDRALLDAVNDLWLLDVSCFQNGRHNVDDVMDAVHPYP
jgi:hypothetical protein